MSGSGSAKPPKNALFTVTAQPSHDVILISSDNIRFHVHKSHLVMFSTVFADMFTLEHIIDQDPVPIIPLPGDDANVLQDMLPYFYPFEFEVAMLHERGYGGPEGTTMTRLKAGLEFADKYALKEYIGKRVLSTMRCAHLYGVHTTAYLLV